MSKVVLLLGGNQGDRAGQLSGAADRIASRIGRIIARSEVYESEPWGFTSGGPFLNQVLVVRTGMEPLAVLDETQAIERELGRLRQTAKETGERHYEARPIDIDLLFYDRLCFTSDRLTIPHPLISERRFVLVPLAEVMSEFVHPEIGKSIRELLEGVPEKNIEKK